MLLFKMPRCQREQYLICVCGMLVEPIGIEPMTPCLQSRCSPS